MPHKSKISEATVRAILLTHASHQKTAAIHGVSWQAVQQIRLGKIHKKTAPEVPRWANSPKHSCAHCRHWLKGACSLGFPEPTENLLFASECNLYSK
jgi:hypothetical protein